MIEKSEAEKIANEYIAKKEQDKGLQKELKTLNVKMMQFMNESNLNTFSVDSGTINVQIRNTSSWDEEMLIDFCEKNNINCVETKVVKSINPDLLEDEIIKNPALSQQLKQFQHVSESKVLTYKAAKMAPVKKAEESKSEKETPMVLFKRRK